MPAGVNVVIDQGFAIIDFVNPKLRGPGLIELLRVGGPATIQSDSRRGPRKVYIVPEGNAREAGLLDEDNVVDALPPKGTSAGDATGMVNPTTPTVAGQVHGPVLRQGTYRGGDTGNIDTAASDPVPADVAAPAHTEVIAQVKEAAVGGPVPQGIEPGSVPAPETSPAYIGMRGTPFGTVQEPSAPKTDAAYPEGEPSQKWNRKQIDAYAKEVKGIDTTDLPDKAAALAALS